MSSATRKRTPSSTSSKKKHETRVNLFLRKKTKEKINRRNQALIDYVTNQESRGNVKIIEMFCKKQVPKTVTLYRGHMKSQEIRKSAWFSASKSKQVAKEQFSGKNCCVFTIHVMNVPIIDINKVLKHKIGDYAEEEECIILGGGSFYKNASLTELGFLDIGNGDFECWYTLTDEKDDQTVVERALGQISEDEYDIIETPSDIFLDNLTESQKKMVFDEIMRRKSTTF